MFDDQFVKSKIKLTIGMLVSNHIEYIEKCMEGLKPLLDAIPSELIVVDTVGPEKTDGSIDIVRRYTDKIYPFTWCNDFSAARNVCFEHAEGEWFMFQDDDEYFTDVTEMIDFFKGSECNDYYTAMYHVNNHVPNGEIVSTVAQRIVRRRPDTCFVGRVHECFSLAYEPCKIFFCATEHFGYMLSTEESVRAHQNRNLAILNEEIKENGLDARLAAQLVQERIFTEGTEDQGYNDLCDCLKKLSNDELLDAGGQWLLSAGVRYLKNSERYGEAVEEAKHMMKHPSAKEFARMIIAGVGANSAAKLNNIEECLYNVREYIRLYDWLLEHPREMALQVTLDMEKHRTKEYLSTMLRCGVIASSAEKEYDECLSYWKRLNDMDADIPEAVIPNIYVSAEKATNQKLRYEFYSKILTKEGLKLYGFDQ